MKNKNVIAAAFVICASLPFGAFADQVGSNGNTPTLDGAWNVPFKVCNGIRTNNLPLDKESYEFISGQFIHIVRAAPDATSRCLDAYAETSVPTSVSSGTTQGLSFINETDQMTSDGAWSMHKCYDLGTGNTISQTTAAWSPKVTQVQASVSGNSGTLIITGSDECSSGDLTVKIEKASN